MVLAMHGIGSTDEFEPRHFVQGDELVNGPVVPNDSICRVHWFLVRRRAMKASSSAAGQRPTWC
ncbi:MAG TPA: hypothetical protein GX399_02380 [Xanthomonadaceae bacterium]|nr:hypothetical protein [Xanthomonadaceae bacterium]